MSGDAGAGHRRYRPTIPLGCPSSLMLLRDPHSKGPSAYIAFCFWSVIVLRLLAAVAFKVAVTAFVAQLKREVQFCVRFPQMAETDSSDGRKMGACPWSAWRDLPGSWGCRSARPGGWVRPDACWSAACNLWPRGSCSLEQGQLRGCPGPVTGGLWLDVGWALRPQGTRSWK